MNNSLRKAAATVTEQEKEDILDRMETTLGLAIEEMQNSRGAARQRAAETVRLMKSMRSYQELRERTITPEETKEIIQALHLASTSYSKLKDANDKRRGKDGLTITERERDRKAQVLNQDRVLELLRAIKQEQEDRKEEAKKEATNIKATVQDGLAGFLGPFGPLYTTWRELKEEYGDDTKRIIHKMGTMVGYKRNELKEFGLQAEQRARRDNKLFSMLNHQFRRMTGLLKDQGGQGGWLRSLLGFGKRGTGKGGAFTKLKRFLRKIPGIKGLMRGKGHSIGKIGKGAKGLKGFLGKGISGAGRVLGGAARILPFIGAGLGAMDLLEIAKNGGERAERGEGIIGDYASGALSGAAIGFLFGPVGAAVGAVVGLAFTGIVRNWHSLQNGVKANWDKVIAGINDRWNTVRQFGQTFVADIQAAWESVREKIESIYKWFKDTIPNFDDIKGFARRIVNRSIETVQNSTATVAGNMAGNTQSIAQSAPSAAQNIGRAIAGDKGAAIGERVGNVVGRAAQSVSNFVGKLAMPSKEVKTAITSAATKNGVDTGYMMAMAGQESSFNPNAGAKTSSAQGLYQFTRGTWKSMVQKYGAQTGIGLGDIKDPSKNATMAALFTRDNAQILTKSGLEAGPTELYATHVLGSGGGPQLLKQAKQNPNAKAADLFPDAARANKNIFYTALGQKRTVSEVYQVFHDKVGSKAQAYNNALEAETKLAETNRGTEGAKQTLAQTKVPETVDKNAPLVNSTAVASSAAAIKGSVQDHKTENTQEQKTVFDRVRSTVSNTFAKAKDFVLPESDVQIVQSETKPLPKQDEQPQQAQQQATRSVEKQAKTRPAEAQSFVPTSTSTQQLTQLQNNLTMNASRSDTRNQSMVTNNLQMSSTPVNLNQMQTRLFNPTVNNLVQPDVQASTSLNMPMNIDQRQIMQQTNTENVMNRPETRVQQLIQQLLAPAQNVLSQVRSKTGFDPISQMQTVFNERFAKQRSAVGGALEKLGGMPTFNWLPDVLKSHTQAEQSASVVQSGDPGRIATGSTFQSVAPAAEAYTRAMSLAPGANVRMQPPPPPPQNNGGMANGVVGVNKTVHDIPMVLGDPPYIVVNSNMVGA